MVLLKNIALTIIAILLFFPLTFINLILVLFVGRKTFYKTICGYFFSAALNIDKFACREFRTLWNLILINKSFYHSFGNNDETISYCLGINKKLNALSKTGIFLCAVLNWLDKDHVEKAVIIHNNNVKNKQ